MKKFRISTCHLWIALCLFTLLVLFDPEALKETKTLSRVELKQPKEGVSKKNAVLNATIELVGPAAATKAWVKQINTGTVLGQIDSSR